jgi:hypothetical protein
MTEAQAVALRQLLEQLGTPRVRQFWRQAQTHANDYTCQITQPTAAEIEAIAQLMKVSGAEDTP